MVDQVHIEGMQDQPVRRYTYAGRVAHLLAFTTDFSAYPYAFAFCGFSPQWGSPWLGSGSQGEEDEASRLRTCKRCNAIAQQTADFIADLKQAIA